MSHFQSHPAAVRRSRRNPSQGRSSIVLFQQLVRRKGFHNNLQSHGNDRASPRPQSSTPNENVPATRHNQISYVHPSDRADCPIIDQSLKNNQGVHLPQRSANYLPLKRTT